MKTNMPVVTVHGLPEIVTAVAERNFIRDLQRFVETKRPCLVVNCSRVMHMDDATLHLILCCLEEAMKRNGDAKLAGLSREAKATSQFAVLRRLFEIYSTPAEAIQSYRFRGVNRQPCIFEQAWPEPGAENAA
jgi:anti-anti-sigma regulatory factor